MKIAHFDKSYAIKESAKLVDDAIQVPEVGQRISTKKSKIEGIIEQVDTNKVFYRTDSGKLMKSLIENVYVIEDWARPKPDNHLMTAYKKSLSEFNDVDDADEESDKPHGLYMDGKLRKTYSSRTKAENVKNRDPKFKDAVIKELIEAGINRCAPDDISHEHDLDDVYDKWKGDVVKVQERGPYSDKFSKMIESNFDSIINEISKSTLGSYIKKASKDVADRSNEVGYNAGKKSAKYNTSDESDKEVKRHRGISKAVDKLTSVPVSSGNRRDDAEYVDYKDN